VWFYDMQNDGYDLDDKRRPSGKSDLQDIINQYHNRKSIPSTEEQRDAIYFSISKQEIVENGYDLSFSKYREDNYEELIYEQPGVILEKLIGENGLEKEIIKGLEELKSLF
jgi:type I restriction enzyme M protein